MKSMKTAIGASLPEDLFKEFVFRADSFPGGKTGLIKESLRAYIEANPLTEEQRAWLKDYEVTKEKKA